jgi:hypothetical protein
MIFSLLKEVVTNLDKAEIPYMVSGSIAMTIYTIPRMTRDIDIVIELKKEDIDKFCRIFAEGAYIDKLTVEEEVKRRGMFNVIDHRTGYKIDFMVKKFDEYRENEFQRRIRDESLGFPAWFVSIEDLILSKLIWIQEYQSDKQKEDILNLLDNETANIGYIKKWCYNLDLQTFNLI